MSEMLTVRIPRETKAEMENLKINWSEYIRESIQKKLVEARRELAFKEMDEITQKISRSKQSMADEVVKWRKKR
jgi:hypothetical protein